MLSKPHILIISPALAKANNGNWQTAQRWEKMLRLRYRVSVAAATDALPQRPPDVLIVLHALRSAQALAAFAARFPALPAILVLTGTDLYRDIASNSQAQHSLQLASQLVVLQTAGLQQLDAALRSKTQVIYQSAATLKPIVRTPQARHFDVTMIGHLRDEKDPLTFMRAAGLVTAPAIRLIHIGGALDPALGLAAEATQRAHAHYRWLGNVSHSVARQRLKRSQVMVIASKLEGGANVIIEAVTSGVPVIASDISGNRGMLGEDYAGYFPAGDSAALTRMIEKYHTDATFYQRLKTQCQARAALFTPEREQTALLQLVDNVLSRQASQHSG